ncbi:MAG: ORF6N domain-containing protein [Massilioclostridium sp.]|nr:ORF6N domain-containing protein [Massilioclostridium sp.]
MKPIEYKGQKVITTKLLAKVYQATEQQIQQNFKNHEEQFVADKHYFYLRGEELKAFKRYFDNIEVVHPATVQLYLWTERGANRHCKILDTDKAWEQFDNLEEAYFKVKKNALPAASPQDLKYLNGLANYLRVQRTIMKDKGCSALEVAEMDKLTCDTYGVPVPECLASTPPFQLSISDPLPLLKVGQSEVAAK